VFSDDTVGVYREAGTYHGRDAVSRFIQAALSQCGSTQHLVGSIDIQVDGDRATASSYLRAIHLGKKQGYEGRVWTFWGEYLDELKRTPAGWRISRRELNTIHMDGDIGLQM
jgi:SnoaL-like domain